MRRETLLDFFEDFASSNDTFVVHDDGYRVREVTYRQLADAADVFSSRLTSAGIRESDNVVIWSENRTEWLIVFWGCVLARVVVVPVDFRTSEDLLHRIAHIVNAKAMVVGDEVKVVAAAGIPIWWMRDVSLVARAGGPGEPRALANAGTQGSSLAEIIFTSGATADPKGVTITHRNILANVIPIEREIAKYRKYARPFHPIRFLNLLPLSHMFGQSMATFVPPMFRGTVIFSHGYSPAEILHQVKSRRVSVLVCVPKVLDVLREHMQRVLPATAGPDELGGKHWAWRWWRYRAAHRLFGWKFWCIVVGAAPLDPDLEMFWRKLGFLVVQGYGLTETAPIVTLNHPFRASRGTVGTPIAGVEVKIADDGEILVRGENVTSGYYNAANETAAAFQDGWFHTGDIGEIDAAGRLVIKGRKKEMIVTAQGLNVFPEDVERALIGQPGVVDAGVIGRAVNGEERIHAVLVLTAGADVDAIVRAANSTLEDHQRVWSTSVWPGQGLPRTEGTQKLKRRELQRWATGERAGDIARPAGGTTVEEVVGRFAAGRELKPETTLDELGLSSLDRVELMMALEDTFQVTLDEGTVEASKSIRELKTLVAPIGGDSHQPHQRSEAPVDGGYVPAGEPLEFPAWNRWAGAWFLRRISLPTWILPLARVFLELRVDGLEHLRGLEGPVIFASNHQSHMDTPTILIALPARWRYRVATAMSREFFYAHFHRRVVGFKSWLTNSLNYVGACMFFNAFPMSQGGSGTRQTMRYIGEVTRDGYSVLIFPEGERRADGELAHFRAGVGMIGARLDLPVIPVRLDGLDKVLHKKMKWPKRGPVRVVFGAPIRLAGEDYPALAAQIEAAVRQL